MKFSIVTVCFNAAAELEETMLSVLGQDFPQVEYIVIDGGSTDGSVDIIKKYADRLAYWVSEPDGGIYDAMNKGIAHATGDYINFMNAGDRFASPSVLSQIAQQSNSAGVIYGNLYYITNGELELRQPQSLKNLWLRSTICHQSAFFANKGAEISYNIKYRLAADHELFCRLYYDEKWTFKYIPIPICIYAGGGISEHNRNCMREFKEIAKPYKSAWVRIPAIMWIGCYDRFGWTLRKLLGESLFNIISRAKRNLFECFK